MERKKKRVVLGSWRMAVEKEIGAQQGGRFVLCVDELRRGGCGKVMEEGCSYRERKKNNN